MDTRDRIVREKERRQITGLSLSTWWRLEKDGKCPKKVKLSKGAVGWKLSELQAWIADRAQVAA